MWWLCAHALAAASPELAVQEAVAARLDVPVTDVEVGPLGLPQGLNWVAELPSVGPVWGKVRVTVRGVLPSGDARYVLSSDIQAFRQLPIAASAVRAGEVVPVTTARVAMDSLRGATPVDPAGTWVARTDMLAQAPLTTRSVRPRPDAQEGQSVRIVAGSGAVRVSAPGQLGEDAFVGAEIHVVNLATRAVLVGRYTAEGEVLVGELR
jgi:flagella basal body P-ring formation protein FlgA